MKLYFSVILVLIPLAQHFCATNIIPLSISQVIDSKFESERFNFIIYGLQTNKIRDLVNQVMKLTSSEPPHEVIQVRQHQNMIKIYSSAVILFDTLASYLEFHTKIVFPSKFPKKFNFLIYIIDLDDARHRNVIVKNVLFRSGTFLIQNNDQVRLITFETFQQPKCRQWNSVEINFFSNIHKKWSRNKFFHEKFNNFNGCELIIMFPYPYFPIFGAKFNKNGVMTSAYGYGTKMLQSISQSSNYKLIWNPFNIHTRTIYNRTLGADCVLFIQALRYIQIQNNKHFTSRISTMDSLLLISRYPPYTQLEKLILPFDTETWTWLILTLVIAVISIVFLKLARKEVQEFVFGRNVSSPMLNLL